MSRRAQAPSSRGEDLLVSALLRVLAPLRFPLARLGGEDGRAIQDRVVQRFLRALGGNGKG